MNSWESKKCNKCTVDTVVEVVKNCENADVIAQTLPCCDSYPVNPIANCVNIIKVPVVLTEQILQVDLESEIKFEEPVFEVKRIRKNVYITQCKVIVTKYSKTPGCSKGKIYLGGYVRKNVEYATNECISNGITNGNIKHLTVNVPFKCVTNIIFDVGNPVLSFPYKQDQFEVLGENCSCKCNELLTGKKNCEDIFLNKEDFMEQIFCEFEGTKILEIDLHEESDDDCCYCGNSGEIPSFTGMTEKMAVYLKVKILQKQQVRQLNYTRDDMSSEEIEEIPLEESCRY